MKDGCRRIMWVGLMSRGDRALFTSILSLILSDLTQFGVMRMKQVWEKIWRNLRELWETPKRTLNPDFVKMPFRTVNFVRYPSDPQHIYSIYYAFNKARATNKV